MDRATEEEEEDSPVVIDRIVQSSDTMKIKSEREKIY